MEAYFLLSCMVVFATWMAFKARNFIFMYVLASVFVVFRLFYSMRQKMSTSKNGLKYMSETCLDTCTVFHFTMTTNDKSKDIKIIQPFNGSYRKSEFTSKTEFTYLYNDLLEKEHLRNNFVHCSIMKLEEDGSMIDVTSIMREFFFHFDRSSEDGKFKYVLDFFKTLYPSLELDGSYFVMYKNDETFTEVKFLLTDLSEHYLAELFV